MAIAVVASASNAISGASSLTISLACSGSDRAVLLLACCVNSADYLASATSTYNGVSMGSPVVSDTLGSSVWPYGWLLVAPATGTNNLVLTPSAGAFITAHAIALSGVDQATPTTATDHYRSATGASPRTMTIAGDLVVDMFARRTTGSSMTMDGSQTQFGTTQDDLVGKSAASYKAGASAMEWTFTGGLDNIAQIAVALKAAAGGGGGHLRKTIQLMGG